MNSYTNLINNIKSIEYNKYVSVSSREKLAVYAIKYLNENNIPASFNNICVTLFKLFPDKFYFSEQFKDYPHIEMINRTLLHLRPKERNYATGGTRILYKLTKLGEEIAKQVESEINLKLKKQHVVKKIMDDHKAESDIEYLKLKNSSYNKKNIDGNYDEMDVWSYFRVTPFTQIDKIKNIIKEIRSIAEEKKDHEVIDLINKFSNTIF